MRLDIIVDPTSSMRAVFKFKKPQQDRKSSKEQKSSTDTKDAQGPKTRLNKPTPKLTRDDKYFFCSILLYKYIFLSLPQCSHLYFNGIYEA